MRSRLPAYVVFLTVMLDGMGVGLIIPVMPGLIRDVTGGDIAGAAAWGGVLATGFAVMQFLFGPVLGNLSDRFGRRPVLLVSTFAMAGGYLVSALAGSIWVILMGRVVTGITAATQSTAGAYMADISRPEDKAANFGLVGAAMGLGFVFGPLIGGALGVLGPRAPFFAAAAMALVNFTMVAALLPESLTDALRRPFSLARANPFGALRAIGHLPGLRRLMAVIFLYSIAFTVYPAVWAYFAQARFNWDARMIGVSLAAFGLSMALVQGLLIRRVVRRIGERATVLVGMAFNAAGFLAAAFIANGWVVLALTPVMALGGLTGPSLQGLMSRATGDDQQGELQGVLTSLNALALVFAPVLMTQVFALFAAPGAPLYLPGAPFLISLVLTIAATLLFTGHRRATAQ